MAFDLKKQYETDPEKEIEGVWEPIDETASLLIARVGNDRYNARYRKIPRGIRNQLESGNLSDTMNDSLVCRLLADTILLDWKDIADGGKAIKYSEEAAYNQMLKYPDFRELVWQLGKELARFRKEDTEDIAKNSKAS